jgi:hypothetical protein
MAVGIGRRQFIFAFGTTAVWPIGALLRLASLSWHVMSDMRDQLGISSLGVPRIMPTTGASRRVTKRQPENDRDTENALTEPNHLSPSPNPPGTGRLVDKRGLANGITAR